MTGAELCNVEALQCLGLTFDVDWAPAFAVEAALRPVLERGLRATVFATHPCDTLRTLAASGEIEIGLHPNFAPGSSHGATEEAVLDTLLAWYPEARGLRTHMLIQSSPLLARCARRGLRWDASLLLDDLPCLQPFRSGSGLVRLPYVWGDANHLALGRPLLPSGAEALDAAGLSTPGLKIVNFHPILLALNASSPANYAAFKRACPDVGAATPADVLAHASSGRGLRDLFLSWLDALVARGVQTYTLTEAAACAVEGAACFTARAAPAG